MSRIVEEFIELTAIPSPSKGERAMADALKRKLEELGCEVREDNAAEQIPGTAGNITAVLRGTVGQPVLFASHMDRVPNGDCIRPVLADGKLTSGGSTILAADDVSGIAAILDGLRRVKESGLPHCDVEIAFTACEELLVTGSRYLDFGSFRAKHCYCIDSPGHTGRIINAAPGKAMVYIEVFGKPAHAGQAPEKGVNALIMASKVMADMRDGRLDEETTANWAIISAGKVTNVVCDHVEVCGEVRSRDPRKVEEYIAYVERHCQEVISKTPATCKVRVERIYDGFCIPHEDPLLTTLCGVLEQRGITPLIEMGGGGMDANRFNAMGIKSVGVASGYFKNHSTEEELYVEDLEHAGRMVYDLIMAWSGK